MKHFLVQFKEEYNREKKVVKALESMEASEDIIHNEISNMKGKLIELLQVRSIPLTCTYGATSCQRDK